ncbi:2,3-diphosphoglycerate-dependent phosphoglycerate mutase [Streptomyces sp. NPDC059398]|uniref:2,3-bisphosphoglycerate-dependent phosphoglycerate mutase n=1 Tax=Streptomyces sp. NPDC059398 TaxID=3346820 RepID=UPI003676EDD1
MPTSAAGPFGTLVLMRHGQSSTNAEGRFTGWSDTPLTARGEREAAAAASLLSGEGLVPGVVHTSALHRSIRSAEIVLDGLDLSWIPVFRTWRLNERQYGALTGRLKSEVRQEAGGEQYRLWRRSLTGTPGPLPEHRLARLRADPRYAALRGAGIPEVESLADMIARVVPYWTDVLADQLHSGHTVLVVAHGNAIRALVAVLDRLSEHEVEELNIPTGAPLHYVFDDRLRPVRRGGRYLDPAGAREAAEAVAVEGHD